MYRPDVLSERCSDPFLDSFGNGFLGSSLRPGSLPLLTLDLIYTTAMASISIKNSGKAKRVTPSSVLAGRQPAADKRVVIVSQASKHLSTSVV